MHFFDRATGTLAGRVKTGGDRVTNAPLAVNGIVYVISDKGDLVALHGLPIAARAAKAGEAAGRARAAAPAAPASDADGPTRPRRAADATALQSPESPMLPVIAIVGRPNVGKSTLFNTLTQTRDAIVADVPGVTRDRQYGYGKLGPVQYVCIDTGGLVENPSGMDALMRIQTEHAIKEADRLSSSPTRAPGSRRRTSSSRTSCAARANRYSSR